MIGQLRAALVRALLVVVRSAVRLPQVGWHLREHSVLLVLLVLAVLVLVRMRGARGRRRGLPLF